MDYYNDYRDRQRPYGRHEDSVPDDIDGPPPPGYLFGNSRPPPSNHPHWAPPTFRGGPEYRTSPPRGFGSYPYSPERGRPRDEGVFSQPFPRMEPPSGYSDYGGPPLYASDYGHDFGPEHARGSSLGDYDYASRPPVQVYPPDYDRRPPLREDFEHDHGRGLGHGHGEFDRRPLPPREEFDRRPLPPREEFDRRPLPPREEFDPRPPPPREEFEPRPPPPEVYPPPPDVYPPAPPTRHVQFDTEVHVHHHPEDPRFDESDGRPPPRAFEPEPHFHGHETHIHETHVHDTHGREAHGHEAHGHEAHGHEAHGHEAHGHEAHGHEAHGHEAHSHEAHGHGTHGPSPPRDLGEDGGGPTFIPPPTFMAPPPPVMTHDRGLEPEPVFIPPMSFEPPMGRSPHHHGHGDPREFPVGPGAMPYIPDMGGPPPFPAAHYGVSMEHGHVKRKHFEGCKDYWAGFLFLMHFWAVVGVCIYLGVRGVIKTNQNNDLLRQYEMAPTPAPSPAGPVASPVAPTELYSIKHWAPQLATAAASGWVFAFVWQWLVRTKTMIKVCLSLGAVATGLLGIILVSTGTAKGLVGLIFLVLALFQGLYVHLVRHRIPFAADMLGRTRLVVKQFKGLYVISMWTVCLAMFWLAIWVFGVSGAVSLPYGGWYAALLVLSLAWSMEVLRNIVFVTVAGVVGTYYYEGHNHMPHAPVLRAYQRAWTISFGSVCLGSMFVAPVQTLHAIAKRLANEQGANEFLFSCVNCFLGVLEFFNRHFNKWAFVEVGLHGKSFVRSAKQTWHMFKEQGAMLLINDDLTGAILLTSCMIGGVLTALVGGCWTFATNRYLTVGVSIISFFIGFFVTYLTLVVPESAVASYYVCFAEDPSTLEKHNEPLWQYMRDRKLKLDQETE